MDQLLSFKWKNHISTFIKKLAAIRNDETYSDVTLACSGKFYSVHKMVLTACSDYFQEIFYHTECKKPVIVLNGVSSLDLEAILDYMYIGEMKVKESDVYSIMKAAEYLQIKGLGVADEETDEKSRTFENVTKSPNKCKSAVDNAKHIKLNENTHLWQEHNDFSQVFVKEESFDNDYKIEDIQDNENQNTSFSSQPSSSKSHDSYLEVMLSETNSAMQEATSDSLEGELNMASYEYEPTYNQSNKRMKLLHPSDNSLMELPHFKPYVHPYLLGMKDLTQKQKSSMRDEIIRQLQEYLDLNNLLQSNNRMGQSWGYRKLHNAMLRQYPNIIKENNTRKRATKGELAMLISRLADRRRKLRCPTVPKKTVTKEEEA